MNIDSLAPDDPTNQRLLEEIRDNLRDGFSVVVNKPRYRSVAARAFIALSSVWGLSLSEAAALLGVPDEEYRAWNAGNADSLSAESLEKISCLMGIYKSLCTLYSGHTDRVGAWLKRKNNGMYYRGNTPYKLLLGADPTEFHGIRRNVASKLV